MSRPTRSARALFAATLGEYGANDIVTVESDRRAIRRQLGIQLEQPGTTPYGAARAHGGPISHEAVMGARQAHPADTCQQLAERLGCSISTVKRHLRRAREQHSNSAPIPTATRPAPSTEAVLDCFDQLETSRSA